MAKKEDKNSVKASSKRKKEYQDDVIYPKTIELKGSVLNILEDLAAEDRRKLKPFMEKKLEELVIKK